MVLSSFSEIDRYSPTNLTDDVEEKKNAMAKSPKSRCCKVDAVKFKGFARSRFVWYWCVHCFRPRKIAIYVPEDNPTPSRLRHYLLASKEKTLIKIEKDSCEGQTLLKLTLDMLRIIDWPASTISCLWRILDCCLLSIGRFSGWPSANWLTCYSIDI
jgi:hypothetical protein